MDKKSKILIWVIVLLIIGSVGATYWRIFVKKDYIISNEIDCDPYSEKCFIWECDSASTVEGEKCTGDPEVDIWYYKIAQRKASNIPLCNPDEDESCLPFACPAGEEGCGETLCEDGNKDGIECINPEQYTIDNPEEEEVISECAEDDDECLAAEEDAIAEECAPEDAECLAGTQVEEPVEKTIKSEVESLNDNGGCSAPDGEACL